MPQAWRSLKPLAEHWTNATPASVVVPSPFAGAFDLSDERAIEASGVLFMESGEAPAEIGRITRELETLAADAETAGSWLAGAMEASWVAAETLLDFPQLGDQLAERHGIIANDWQSATMLQLVSRQLRRANAILERVDFSECDGPRRRPARRASRGRVRLLRRRADRQGRRADGPERHPCPTERT